MHATAATAVRPDGNICAVPFSAGVLAGQRTVSGHTAFVPLTVRSGKAALVAAYGERGLRFLHVGTILFRLHAHAPGTLLLMFASPAQNGASGR